jgi:two-component system, cell cycle sensor histidine kinase and response regulator CckA
MEQLTSAKPLSRIIPCIPSGETGANNVASHRTSGRQIDEAVHDLKNLLLGVDLLLQSALQETPPELPTHGTLEKIHSAFHEARDLCRDMLASHDGHDGLCSPMQPLDLGELLVDLCPLLRSLVPESARFEFEPERNLPLIMGDRFRLHRAVLNLVRNSAAALVGGVGAITVRTGVLEVGRRRDADLVPPHPSCRPGPYTYVEVSDTGCGMDQATLSGLFGRQSARDIGHGLGLLSVQQIVAHHQGFIEVRSEQLSGTAVRLLLPV